MLTSAGIGNHSVRPKNGRLYLLILIPDHGLFWNRKTFGVGLYRPFAKKWRAKN